ncbi:MAG TPA: DUF5777 family beta-barrel protein [Prolixibacteraceae bacterium]|nr:DUF5777 family beta-barrel protein [Prolixibacteraceae bacterium]
MKKNIILIALLSFISVFTYAQEEATENKGAKEKDYPVAATFESGYLIDAQTVVVPEKKTLEMAIQHKFGTIEKGHSNLWGIYGSANIRLGLNYVPFKNFQIGAGITKKNMATDLDAKWLVLQQTRKNQIPVSVALYGNVAVDGRAISAFESGMVREAYSGPTYHYRFQDRVSYFSQLIVARKFNKWLSLQAAASFTHYNAVPEGYDHDIVGAHFNGRIKVTPQGSIIFNYDEPLKIKQISEQRDWTYHARRNISFGYEVSTGTHAFQIYMGSSASLLPQDNMTMNQNKFDKSGLLIGFVITRLWAY